MMVSGWLASPQFAAHPSVVTRADLSLSLPPSPPPLYTHNGTRVSGRCINRKIEISASTIITAIVASNRERFSLSPASNFSKIPSSPFFSLAKPSSHRTLEGRVSPLLFSKRRKRRSERSAAKLKGEAGRKLCLKAEKHREIGGCCRQRRISVC